MSARFAYGRNEAGCTVRGEPPSLTRGRSGQSLVEFALMVPLLFLLMVNAVNFGGFLFAWITVADAARAGGQLLAAGGAANGSVSSATVGQITALVTNDMASLPSLSSLAVRVCSNNNGSVVCTGPGTSTPPLDPEPATYISATVDVSYRYSPPIPLFTFTQLGIQATIPPTNVHSQAVIRLLQ